MQVLEKPKLSRICPRCCRQVIYTTEAGLRYGLEHNCPCITCSRAGPKTSGPAISAALKGRPKSEEHKRKLSEVKKGKPGHPMSAKNKANLIAAITGKPKTEECKRKLSEAMKGRPGPRLGKPVPQEMRDKIRKTLLGRKASPEARAKMSASQRGSKRPPMTEEHRRKIGLASRGRTLSEEAKRKISLATKGRIDSNETKRRKSEAMKRLYAITDIRRKKNEGLKKVDWKAVAAKTRRECPNKYERKLDSVLQELFPNEYKFVGDWSVVIDGLNPDFINVNGQKKIIEVFGEIYHKPGYLFKEIRERATENGRKTAFQRFGYETLVVWCSELEHEDRLKTKLLEFHAA